MVRQLLLAITLVIVATAGFAGDNLVPNPAFDEGLDGYTFDFVLDWFVDNVDGNPIGSGAPSAMCSDGGPGFCELTSPCIDITLNPPPMVMAWGFTYKGENLAGVGSINVAVSSFDDPSCTGARVFRQIATFPVITLDGTWRDIDTQVMTSTDIWVDRFLRVSVGFNVGASDNDTSTASLDDFFLIGTSALIFVDGFESGDVSAWSSSVP